MSRRCERPGCTNGQAEVSKINGIIRMMCFNCTKKMVIENRDRKAKDMGCLDELKIYVRLHRKPYIQFS